MVWLRKASAKMASEDNYKEGIDFVWVQGNGGFKTRKFLSRAEKAAKNAPDKPAVAAAKPKAKAKGFSIDMASKAIDKAAGIKTPTSTTPRPKARPVDMTPKPIAATAKITTTKLAPVATTKVTGRGGYASGPAAGMPQNKAIKNYETLIKSGTASASEVRSAKAALTKLRDAAGMAQPKVKPTYDTTPAKGRMTVDQKLWNKPAAPKAEVPMTKAMKNYEAILNSSTASASEKRSAKAALAALKK